MKMFFLPILMVAIFACGQSAIASAGTSGSETQQTTGETASTADASAAQASISEAKKVEAVEGGNNQAAATAPYDFGAATKLEAKGDGELCVSGQCYKDRAYADYCKATFANCPLPAGSELAPKTPAAPASNVK